MRALVRHAVNAVALMWLSTCGLAHGANCFDVSKGEPHALEGVLERRVFPGSMVDVETGKVSEPGFLIRLDAPICVTGDEFTDPGARFLETEVRGTAATQAKMRKLAGMRVRVELSHPYGAATVHDHRPLVAVVESVAILGPRAGVNRAPPPH